MLPVLLVVAAVAGVFLAGCNTQGCTENHSALPLAQFCSSATGEGVTLDSLQIHGVGASGDSTLLAPGTAAEKVYLPMRASQPETTWCIAYKWKALDFPQLNDTVAFSYEAIPFLADDECGAMYNYRVTDVDHTSHLIDSVKVTEPVITNANGISIKIYFRVDAGEGDGQ